MITELTRVSYAVRNLKKFRFLQRILNFFRFRRKSTKPLKTTPRPLAIILKVTWVLTKSFLGFRIHCKKSSVWNFFFQCIINLLTQQFDSLKAYHQNLQAHVEKLEEKNINMGKKSEKQRNETKDYYKNVNDLNQNLDQVKKNMKKL